MKEEEEEEEDGQEDNQQEAHTHEHQEQLRQQLEQQEEEQQSQEQPQEQSQEPKRSSIGDGDSDGAGTAGALMELTSELVVSLSDHHDDNDNDNTNIQNELWNLLHWKAPAPALPWSMAAMDSTLDVMPKAVRRYCQMLSCGGWNVDDDDDDDDDDEEEEEDSTTMAAASKNMLPLVPVVVRGVVLIALHLVYGPLVTKSRWLGRAQHHLLGHSSYSNDSNNQEHLQAWQDQIHAMWQHYHSHLQRVISYPNWCILVAFVSRHVAFFTQPHPFLVPQVDSVLSLLSDEERGHVVQKLGLGPTTLSSPVGIAKAIQGKFASAQEEQQIFCVLLDSETESIQLSHSCIPNVTLHVNAKNHIVVSSLYNNNHDHDDEPQQNDSENENNNMSLCRILDDPSSTVEERERQISLLFGESCACLLCRYELDPQQFLQSQLNHDKNDNGIDAPKLVRLGNFYLGTRKQPDTARELFLAARRKDACNWDAWHALAAIELEQNKFLAAQRLWMQVQQSYYSSSSSSSSWQGRRRRHHKGLDLQLAKLHAYQYLSTTAATTTAQTTAVNKHSDNDKDNKNIDNNDVIETIRVLPSFQKVVPHVFRTAAVLSEDMCRKIIDWADNDKDVVQWTQQRHYAAPTRDKPIHMIKPILEWFRPWFRQQICPLLAAQFLGTTTTTTTTRGGDGSANFFVHDCFVVQYDATLPSNHLPVHTDESTHSFVLALNDDYKGGGTYLYEQDCLVRLSTGEMLSFRGDLVEHGGEAVTEGTRYILAAFLYHDDDHDDNNNNGNDDNDLHNDNGNNKDDEHDTMIGHDPPGTSTTTTTTQDTKSETKKRPFQAIGGKEGNSSAREEFSFAFKV